MRKTLLAGVAVTGLMFAAQAADANIIFAGSGLSGFLNPGLPGEPWLVNTSFPPTGDFGWGSPGVSAGTTTYTRTTPAVDFEITFIGEVLDPAQIPIGSASTCGGTGVGGTVFCNSPFAAPWIAEFDPATPSSIRFVAPPGVALEFGEPYFVNIFLVGAEPRGVEFVGAWSTPEPATLALLGVGLAGLALARRRKSSQSPAA